MRKFLLLAVAATMVAACATAPQEKGLKDAFEGKFLMGTSMNESQILAADPKMDSLIRLHYNAVVAENCMKHAEIHPEENVWNFELADKLVEYAQRNNMTVTGHCLLWHSQQAPWMFVGDDGKEVTPEVLKERIRTHVTTLMTRYKGKILGWDVINECIESDGSYRQSPYYRILGEEFFPFLFQVAHEADPDCELYLNDYGMNEVGRREGYLRLIKLLQDRGCRIDAIGMQSHIGLDYPDINVYRESMEAFIAAGVKVMITEWDMTANPSETQSADVGETQRLRREMWTAPADKREEIRQELLKTLCPYMDGLPEDIAAAWSARAKEFFDLYVEHADDITRVTTWGVTDAESWKNGFVVPGGVDYPLLFDRNYEAKQVVKDLINEYAK